jgi:hypothetical protein
MRTVFRIDFPIADACDKPIESVLRAAYWKRVADKFPAVGFEPDSDIFQPDFSQGFLQAIHAYGACKASCMAAC